MMLRCAPMSALMMLFARMPAINRNSVGQEMKIVFLVIGLVFGVGAYAVFDLRDDYYRSIELAEANCMILVLADPDVELAPAEIDCTLIVDDDYLLTFEVNEAEGIFVDCLPSAAFFRREIGPRECGLYER